MDIEQIKSQLAEDMSYYLTEKIDVTDNEKSIFKSNVEQWLKDLDLLDFKIMQFTGTVNEHMAYISRNNMIASTDPVVQKIWKLNQIRIKKQQIDNDFE